MKAVTRRAALRGAVLLTIAVGATSAIAEDLTIQHAQGTTTVPANPKTVLVFDLAALDTLEAIGVEVDGVPSGYLPAYLTPSTAGLLKIGSLFEPDYEAVAAAEPDLIIIGGRSSAKYAELAKLASTIDLTPSRDDYIGSAERNAAKLGRIFGKEKEVQALVDELNRLTSELKSLAADAGSALAIITTGGKMSAHGPGSRFGVLYDAYGFKPAAEGMSTSTHGQPISFEFLLETNPDWLFVVDRDAAIGRAGESARQLLDNDLVRQTKAWKEGHIVYVNPATWYLVGGGLQALQMNVDEVTEALRKE